MSRVPVGRLLEEMNQRRRTQENAPKAISTSLSNSKGALTVNDKKEIGKVIQETTLKVHELITLLDSLGMNKEDDDGYSYRSHMGWGSANLKKIRPLKNEVAAHYFSIGEALRTHKIGSDKLIQDYYARIKYFKTRYHATTLTSGEVRRFHESIKELIGGVVSKAFNKGKK